MSFLADESCDFRVVRALRAVAHEVVEPWLPRAQKMTPSSRSRCVRAEFSSPRIVISGSLSTQSLSRHKARSCVERARRSPDHGIGLCCEACRKARRTLRYRPAGRNSVRPLREIDRMDHLGSATSARCLRPGNKTIFKHPMPSTARADARHRQTDSRIP